MDPTGLSDVAAEVGELTEEYNKKIMPNGDGHELERPEHNSTGKTKLNEQ